MTPLPAHPLRAIAIALLSGGLACSAPSAELRSVTTASIDADGRQVTLQYRTDSCEAVDRIEVGFAPDEITLSVFVERPAGCAGIALLRTTTVPLHESVQGRSIRDGSNGATVHMS